jgi:hypothetical protein
MVSFFNGDTVPEHVKQDLIASAQGSMTIGALQMEKPVKGSFCLLPPAGFLALPYQDGMLFPWENVSTPVSVYRIHCRAVQSSEETYFPTADSTLFIKTSDFPEGDRSFVASVEAILADGSLSEQSPEIRFRLTQRTNHMLELPNDLKAKILWANISV